ncbi:uncharacterized protein LOC121778802 isoform X2 [Salvia splendens]|uniref:uncharacterized protein LOC121778802 isoform X2 n=1 Tax=Salvia splendens TaxID=180675 RepID=UPI001C270CFC|nr:uncharacterized protein LOC121778802 isoform X2 [Salvia splendens]
MEREMEKEQRRRKIIARGTDRMALITGRINTLNPDPVLKCSTFTANRSDLPPPQHSRSSSEPLSANDQAFFQSGGCEVPAVKVNPVEEASSTGKDSISRDLDVRKRDQKELTSKNVQLPHNHLLNLLRLINAHAVNSSLSSSEDTRAICSALLGLAVVVLQIIHHYAARSNKEEEGKYEDEDDGSLDGAVKLLELGLVLHQMICAIFVDCSFYLVVVILGLSLV